MTGEASMRDRRKHTRLVLEHEVELFLSDATQLRGTTKDISFSGIFIRCNNAEGIPIGNTCTARLHLSAGDNPETIKIEGEVVRSAASGLGIKFLSIDLAGYQQFRNLMIYNSPDPDRLMAELEKNPGLEIV